MQPYTLLCITVLAFASTVLGHPDDIVFPDHRVNTRIRKNRGTETTTPVSISTRPMRRGNNRPVRKSTAQITTTTPKPIDDDPALEGQIPLHVIRQLNEIEDVEQFFKTFEKAPDFDSAGKVGPVGTRLLGEDENTPKANVETPKAAKCEPELTTVSLYNTSTNTALIFPSCTRVLRCGGCCNSELLSCQPTATGVRDRFFQVYASEYNNGRVVPFSRKEVVKVEEHTKCTCGCRIKAEHCNDFQEYVQEGCRCRCINYEDKQKCENDNVTKIWDYNTCMCRCRETTECSTGFFFNENTCSCKPEPILYSRYGSEDQVRRKPPSNRYGYSTASSHPASSRYRTSYD